jgi:hypothetical protein
MRNNKSVIYGIIMIFLFIVLWSCDRGGDFEDNFQNGIKSQWSPKTLEKWELAKDGENGFYRLKEPGLHDTGVSRPSEYSLIKNYIYSNFTFKCKLRCDAPVNVRYRDVVIIFGYQDDTHFYYVQFSNISDDLHNAIMLVNGEYRMRINKDIPEPVLKDQAFHNVEVKRENEKIEVYYDSKLLMQAEDNTFPSGKLGIGSYDDTASFDDVHAVGKQAVE